MPTLSLKHFDCPVCSAPLETDGDTIWCPRLDGRDVRFCWGNDEPIKFTPDLWSPA